MGYGANMTESKDINKHPANGTEMAFKKTDYKHIGEKKREGRKEEKEGGKDDDRDTNLLRGWT